jgi:hypothetical protein
MPEDFVVHSLRHTMLTRLGLLVDAFTIMKIAGQSSITISQRYVHPSPESVERAFEKLEAANRPTTRKGVGIELGTSGQSGESAQSSKNPRNSRVWHPLAAVRAADRIIRCSSADSAKDVKRLTQPTFLG